ncbi:hypothetical protein [Micromonospora zamorensis]|uniref:hypothetical protein n=1 Tax=Micromonospora zamorensis TaxID=709883 RepID=UPI0033B0AEEF
MDRKPVALGIGVLAVVMVLCGATIGLPLLMFGQADAEAAACEVPSLPGSSPVPGAGTWDSTATTNAATIVAVGRRPRRPHQGAGVRLVRRHPSPGQHRHPLLPHDPAT